MKVCLQCHHWCYSSWVLKVPGPPGSAQHTAAPGSYARLIFPEEGFVSICRVLRPDPSPMQGVMLSIREESRGVEDGQVEQGRRGRDLAHTSAFLCHGRRVGLRVSPSWASWTLRPVCAPWLPREPWAWGHRQALLPGCGRHMAGAGAACLWPQGHIQACPGAAGQGPWPT